MNRRDLEKAIREVGRRMGLDYFYVIGSAAVFASIPNADDTVLTGTRDVDVIPAPSDPADAEPLANRVDFVLGEGSAFDIENGFYVQGVDLATPTFAPKGWQTRARPVRSGGCTGLCMEIHDLAVSKYGAGREKDLEFTRVLARGGHLDRNLLLQRCAEVQADETRMHLIRRHIDMDFAGMGYSEHSP